MNTFSRTRVVARRLAITCGAAALVASCGGASLRSFQLNSRQGTSDAKIESPGYVAPSYVAGAALPTEPLDFKATAWKVVEPADSVRRFQTIARAFGLLGTPVKTGDGSYQMGGIAPNASATSEPPTAYMFATGPVVSWSYSSSTPSASVSSGSASSDSVPTPDTIALPKNLPTVDEAKAKVESYLMALGLGGSSPTISASADEYSVNVTVTARVDGLDADVNSYFTFGENKELASANGFIYDLKKSGDYPLVSPAAAVKRIATSVIVPMLARDATAGAASKATNSIATGEGSTASIVTITKAALVLSMGTMNDDTTYLLPSYRLSTDDGAQFVVPAIEDKYLLTESTNSTTVTNTAGVSPGSPPDGTVQEISKADAQLLVGLTEQGAKDMAAKNGWTLRVASRDGKDFMLTTDYVPNRVNLTIVNSVVTAVVVG